MRDHYTINGQVLLVYSRYTGVFGGLGLATDRLLSGSAV
jgi:hypothetical protein